MSEGSDSFFMRNRRKVWAFTALSVFLVVIGWIDVTYEIGILGIVLHPVALGLYFFSLLVILGVYAFRKFSSSSMPDFDGEDEGITELSTFECEELAKEYLFREDEPVIVNGFDRKKTIPVTDEQSHEAEVEIFEYVFDDKFSGCKMSVQFPVSQDIVLDREWFEVRSPEFERNIREAVRSMENVVVENLSYSNKDQEELLKNNRQELGEAIVREKRVVQYDQRGQPVSERIGVGGVKPDPDQDFSRLVGNQGVQQDQLEDKISDDEDEGDDNDES